MGTLRHGTFHDFSCAASGGVSCLATRRNPKGEAEKSRRAGRSPRPGRGFAASIAVRRFAAAARFVVARSAYTYAARDFLI